MCYISTYIYIYIYNFLNFIIDRLEVSNNNTDSNITNTRNIDNDNNNDNNDYIHKRQ